MLQALTERYRDILKDAIREKRESEEEKEEGKRKYIEQGRAIQCFQDLLRVAFKSNTALLYIETICRYLLPVLKEIECDQHKDWKHILEWKWGEVTELDKKYSYRTHVFLCLF